jgi:hypothetical protein
MRHARVDQGKNSNIATAPFKAIVSACIFSHTQAK